MARSDIAGMERFEEAGWGLAEIVNPDAWGAASDEERRKLCRRMHAFLRMAGGLDVSDMEIVDLPAGVHGEYDPLSDRTTVSSEILLDDDVSSVVATLAHETRHALQSAVMQGLLPYPHGEQTLDEVGVWKDGDEAYDDDDVVAYMYNPLETDARAAENGVLIGYWKGSYDRLRDKAGDSDAS